MTIQTQEKADLYRALTDLQHKVLEFLVTIKDCAAQQEGSLIIGDNIKTILLISNNIEPFIDEDAMEQMGVVSSMNTEDTNEAFIEGLIDTYLFSPESEMSPPDYLRLLRMKDKVEEFKKRLEGQ